MESSRLAGVPVFSGLPEAELAAIADAASEFEVGQGEEVATEGDFGHAMYAIESGTAEVRLDGKPPGKLGPGDVFGEIAAIDGGPRTATGFALEDTVVVAISPRQLNDVLDESSELRAMMMAAMEERLGRIDAEG